MSKFTICLAVDQPDEVRHVAAWLTKWKDKVQYLSENNGCGCCIDMYDVEGPEEALAELANEVRASSEWSQYADYPPSRVSL